MSRSPNLDRRKPRLLSLFGSSEEHSDNENLVEIGCESANALPEDKSVALMPKKIPSPKPSSSGSISESDVRVQFSISLLESEKAKKEDKTPKKSINLRETISIPIIRRANQVS